MQETCPRRVLAGRQSVRTPLLPRQQALLRRQQRSTIFPASALARVLQT
ncbi:hypothetical protein [Janthinobacterium sp. NKUCC06_STL]|nr:hypothetical protein [Janthinobacterium sp. NKUCC06_STL]MBW3509692.1 hypothetical protein [Janthinobacterium sp. NKUCC06_STL]